MHDAEEVQLMRAMVAITAELGLELEIQHHHQLQPSRSRIIRYVQHHGPPMCSSVYALKETHQSGSMMCADLGGNGKKCEFATIEHHFGTTAPHALALLHASTPSNVVTVAAWGCPSVVWLAVVQTDAWAFRFAPRVC